MNVKRVFLCTLIISLVVSIPVVPAQSIEPADEGARFREGEVLVELNPGASIEAVNFRNGTETIKHLYGTNYFLLKVPAGKRTKKWVRKLSNDSDVMSASRNPVVTSPSLFARATASFPDGFARTGLTQADFVAQQQLFDFLSLGEVNRRSRGEGIVVAIIDTGIDRRHPLLAERMWIDDRDNADVEGDGLDNDNDGLLDDSHGWDFIEKDKDASERADDPVTTVAGHGTFIAGLVALLAPACRIMPVRAFPSDGVSDAFTVAAAVKYAADHGANVINLSLGSPEPSDLLQKAILDARERGIAIVAAVGNDNSEVVPQFPSTMGEVMAVAAIELNDRKAEFSNFGPHVDLSAPGSHLISAYPDGNYASWSGTSFAAPFAAAEAALVLAADPKQTDVAKTIEDTAVNIEAANPGLSGKLGKGKVSPLEALKRVSSGSERNPFDLHLQVDMVRGAAGGDAGGTATVSVLGDLQEFTFDSYRLNVRSTYKLVVDGINVGPPGSPAQSPASSLGSLHISFAGGPGRPPLPTPLNPVTKVRRVELRDSLDRVVLQGTFETESTVPRLQQKEAQLNPTGLQPIAAGKAIATIEALRDNTRREALRIRAEGLIPGTPYRVIIDTVSFDVVASAGYVELFLSSDGSSGRLLPPSLKPVTNLRGVKIVDARGQAVLQGFFASVSQQLTR